MSDSTGSIANRMKARELLSDNDSTRAAVQTRASTESELFSTGNDSARYRLGWQQVIDRKLIEWGKSPDELRDDYLIPPTPRAIDNACAIALEMRNAEQPPPTWVGPDGDGGVIFELSVGGRTISIEILFDGQVERVDLVDGRIQSRQKLK